MNRRETFWNELKNFCEYIERWYPDIDKIQLYGSCLWKDEPEDIDVWVEGGTDYILEAYKELFPNIHVTNGRPPKDHLFNWYLVWTREKGTVLTYLPIPKKEEVLLREVHGLRNQVDFLKTRIHTHSHKSGSLYGKNNPYWMLQY